ncbi:MAG: flagellar basal body rod protein FlgC [Deltaproteobacteria bacterium]|nr:flagellar basal body rod protein FlgC [Deltaproteobacteria bacterium]
MNFFDSMQTSASGLTAQRLRMNLVATNLANTETTRTEQGGPYQRKEPVFAATPVQSAFGEVLKAELGNKPSEVNVVEVINDQRKPLLKFDPLHPDADPQGFVSLPNINVMEEMVNMMAASRSYEANVTAISTSKNMVQKALEIGR